MEMVCRLRFQYVFRTHLRRTSRSDSGCGDAKSRGTADRTKRQESFVQCYRLLHRWDSWIRNAYSIDNDYLQGFEILVQEVQSNQMGELSALCCLGCSLQTLGFQFFDSNLRVLG